VELRRLDAKARPLPVLASQARLGIEGIDLRRPTVHVEKDDACGTRAMMSRPRARDIAVPRRLGEPLLVCQRGERDGAESVGAATQHLPAGETASRSLTRHFGVSDLSACPTRHSQITPGGT